MQNLKQHIATVLLVGFLFPQVLNSMHYLLISHTFSSETKTAVSQADPNFQYHTCHYHLNSISSTLPADGFLEETLFTISTAKPLFYSLENFVHQPNYDFQLRGPPY